MNWTVSQLIELLKRFPQCAYISGIGNIASKNIMVFAPKDGSSNCDEWKYYKVDAPDKDLEWLNQGEKRWIIKYSENT